MSIAKTSYRNSLLTISKIIIMGLLFLILFTNLIIAQSQSPKAGQWKSVGGKIAFSGKHSFKTMWHLGGNNMYWKNDEDRIKTPPTHPFDNEVRNDVIVKKGQITVQGPGHIGAFVRSIRGGTSSSLTFSKSGKEFWTASLGRQELLGSGDNWNWQDIFINDFDPSVPNKGWVPANKTVTLDVWAASEHTRGTWFQGYAAPRGVEYEYWFFPGKGGKVINTSLTTQKVTPVNNKKRCRKIRTFVYKSKVAIGAPTNRETSPWRWHLGAYVVILQQKNGHIE